MFNLFRFIAYLRRNTNDAKLEASYAQQMERQRSRIQQDTLKAFYENYQTPEERMAVLTHGSEGGSRHWSEKLLSYYGLNMTIDGDTGEVIFTDRLHFGLKNRTVTYPVATFIGADEASLIKVVRNARTRLNRRAVRAGLVAKQARPGNPGKRVTATLHPQAA